MIAKDNANSNNISLKKMSTMTIAYAIIDFVT